MRISQDQIKLFKQICKYTTEELKIFLNNFLSKFYNNIIRTKDYIIAEGDIPIALCAHMDTVALYQLTKIFYDAEEQVMWSPDLLGADDRAGVFAILLLIAHGYKPTVIFTDEEEVGGIGAKALVTRYPKFPFGKIKCIIELDRTGSKDAVFYLCDNRKFESYINSYGFKTNVGSFSDISVIAPKWDCAAVNLSVGYYNEHSEAEYLNFNELFGTIEKVKKILDDASGMPYFNYVPLKFDSINMFTRPQIPKGECTCGICMQKIGSKEKRFDAYGLIVCRKCYEEYCV